MAEKKEVLAEVSFERVSKIISKIAELAQRKRYRPAEVYMACQLLMMDLEKEFNIRPMDDAKKFLEQWRTQNFSDKEP